jgi:ribosomal protein RSM22 (predicted rRNA methylase)
MHIPAQLAEAIEQQMEHRSINALAAAVEALSTRYREGKPGPLPEAERLAYLATRLPATYAAVSRVLQELDLVPASALDLGAGPGSSAWAIWARYPDCRIECLEQDAPFIRLGKQVIEAAGRAFEINWRHADMRSFPDWSPRDLVMAAFALGELDAAASQLVLRNAWQSARQALVIIEPGTPAGFERVRTFRDLLIQDGATIAAPCPHQQACPITNGDWCHFAQRVERSRLHRRLKAGSLSWEDEKFSYLIALRDRVNASAEGRIIRHPQIQSGFVRLQLCTPDGLVQKTVGRGNRALFKQARKAAWGDAWINPSTQT